MSLVKAATETALHPKGMISFLSNCSVLLEVLSSWQKHSSKSYWDQPAGQSSSPEALLAYFSGLPYPLVQDLSASPRTKQDNHAETVLPPCTTRPQVRLSHPHPLLHAVGWRSLKAAILLWGSGLCLPFCHVLVLDKTYSRCDDYGERTRQES